MIERTHVPRTAAAKEVGDDASPVHAAMTWRVISKPLLITLPALMHLCRKQWSETGSQDIDRVVLTDGHERRHRRTTKRRKSPQA